MSRLGEWTPTTVEERLDRMESLAAITQLPYRYALGLDSRNMDELVLLFPPDVRVGRDARGRDALKRWFTDTMRVYGASVHLVGNHIVDFDDADHARGIVYCHDELERPDTGRWEWGKLQYWDSYVRVEGEWFFERRKFHRWYIVDALERPSRMTGAEDTAQVLSTTPLPDAFASWGAFWTGLDAQEGSR
ncbi:MAG: nuclear transport factor 2 family protein [Acidimicrobiales bacterium]|nr:nuclear transport factor 2 family protein [Acidimicrobiales bacterium]